MKSDGATSWVRLDQTLDLTQSKSWLICTQAVITKDESEMDVQMPKGLITARWV